MCYRWVPWRVFIWHHTHRLYIEVLAYHVHLSVIMPGKHKVPGETGTWPSSLSKFCSTFKGCGSRRLHLFYNAFQVKVPIADYTVWNCVALITIYPCVKADPNWLSEKDPGLTHRHILAYLQKEIRQLSMQAGVLVRWHNLTRVFILLLPLVTVKHEPLHLPTSPQQRIFALLIVVGECNLEVGVA